MTTAAERDSARTSAENRTLVEEGWLDFASSVMPANAGPAQRADMRNAFFAGALFLLTSLYKVLEPGEESTDADVRRIHAILDELELHPKSLVAAAPNEKLA